MRVVWILSLVLMVAACASPKAALAPSTDARSLVPGAPAIVAKALIEEMTQRQFVLTSQAENYLAFDRPIDNAALWPKLDGAPDRLPRARLVMTLTPIGDATRVDARMIILAAPGTPRERAVEASALGVDPRVGDILADTSATLIAERGSDPRMALAVAPIRY